MEGFQDSGFAQVGCNALKADCDVAAHFEGEPLEEALVSWSKGTDRGTDGTRAWVGHFCSRPPFCMPFFVHVLLQVCLFISLRFRLSPLLSFISIYTHRSCGLWCMHSWSWRRRPGNVWFTHPLLTYWFDSPFPFQRPGILTVQGLWRSDSACLTTVEKRSEYVARWLTDWHLEWMWHVQHKVQANILTFTHTCNSPSPAHTISLKEFCIAGHA